MEKTSNQSANNIVHVNSGEHLPPVPASSQGAEVVKQIIEQILANERRRARVEFIRFSSLFLIFLTAMLISGIWFARQLMTQLREERRLMEQSWRLMTGGNEVPPSLSSKLTVPKTALTSALYEQEAREKYFLAEQNREMAAKLKENVKTMTDLLKNKPQDSMAEVRDILQKQQNAIEALNARIDKSVLQISDAEEMEKNPARGEVTAGFITAPISDDLNLRMPIPAL
jgi:uncharacterized protein YneF (UPF0154 family)